MGRSGAVEPGRHDAGIPSARLTQFALVSAKITRRLTSIKSIRQMVIIGFYAAFILRLEVSHFFLMGPGRSVPLPMTSG